MKLIKTGFVAIVLLAVLGFTTTNDVITFEDLKLQDSELPEGFKFTKKLNCKATQSDLFYKNPDIYAMLIGKVINKDYQSFTNGKDEGSILYFEFEKEFEAMGFLEGLMWGGNKPTKAHPEEMLVIDNYLIIWSTDMKSELKKVSKMKVKDLK